MPIPCRELEDLYCQCSQQLFVCALAITGVPARAEDAVHEAFCRMLQRRLHVRDLKAFAFRAVRNAAIDQRRRHAGNEPPLPESIYDPAPQPDELSEVAEFRQQIVSLFHQISDDERETIVQHLYGELTFQEIAMVREVPLSTVASWYRRGLDKLRRKLEVPDGSV